MSDLIFPSLPGIAIERSRAARWKSTVQESVSGKVVAATAYTYPRWRYRLQFEVLRAGAEAELQQLVGLFNRMRGRADTFLFLDEDDSTAAGQQIGVGDGATAIYQLNRSYGGFAEPVLAPQAIAAVQVAGVARAYTPLAGGRIQLATPAEAGLAVTWSGSFYWRCRFDRDEQDFDRFLNQLWKSKSVEFTTEKA